MSQKSFALRLLPALVAGLFSTGAFAAGFQLLEQNASGLGNAYAGSAAVAENASTIFFNPAGMTLLKPREVSLGVTAVNISFKFSDRNSQVGALNGTGNGGDGGGWGFIPNAYLSWALTKDLYVGFGVGAPFGLKTDYDSPWLGAAQSIKFDLKTYNVNPSVAYRVNDKVSLGAGVSWQRIEAEYVRRVAVVALPGPVPAAVAPATPLTLDADSDAWGWNVGALFTLSPNTRVGVSYRSTIKHELEGSISVAAPLTALSSGAKADLKLPDTAVISVVQKLDDRWEMLGDVSWTGWSSIPKVDIIRTSNSAGGLAGSVAQTLETDFRDTWRIALGGSYKYNDAMKVKFGLAWDQTPVRSAEHRLTALPDNDRWWFSLGGQWKPTQVSALDLGVAYLYVRDADIDNNQTLQGRGRVTGTFEDSAWILGAQYSMSF